MFVLKKKYLYYCKTKLFTEKKYFEYFVDAELMRTIIPYEVYSATSLGLRGSFYMDKNFIRNMCIILNEIVFLL